MPPVGILANRRLLPYLSWEEIDDLLLTPAERRLLKGTITLDDLEDEMRRSREVELYRYRSRSGLLDIDNIESTLFKQQFRFWKDDLNELYSALLLPEKIVTEQNVTIPGREALCLMLRRLAYPNRWCDLEQLFGRHSSVMSSCSTKVVSHVVSTFGHLLKDMNNHDWLSPAALRTFARVSRPYESYSLALLN